MRAIYTITVFQKIKKNDSITVKSTKIKDTLDFGDRHCVGWYQSFEEAENAVTNNFGSMYDSMYEYAIIERIESGVKIPDTGRFIYKWNSETKGYDKIESPSELETISNFSIG